MIKKKLNLTIISVILIAVKTKVKLSIQMSRKNWLIVGKLTYYDRKTSGDCFYFAQEKQKTQFHSKLNFKILIIYCSLHTI